MPNNVDLPTPEPANNPNLCPRPTGISESIALTPVENELVIRVRLSGCGIVVLLLDLRFSGK